MIWIGLSIQVMNLVFHTFLFEMGFLKCNWLYIPIPWWVSYFYSSTTDANLSINFSNHPQDSLYWIDQVSLNAFQYDTNSFEHHISLFTNATFVPQNILCPTTSCTQLDGSAYESAVFKRGYGVVLNQVKSTPTIISKYWTPQVEPWTPHIYSTENQIHLQFPIHAASNQNHQVKQVILLGANGRILAKSSTSSSSLTLPKPASPGSYWITIQSDGKRYSYTFLVK